MITRVTINNNVTRFAPTMHDTEESVRSILTAHNVDFSAATVAVNMIPVSNFDDKLSKYGVSDDCFISVTVKATGAARMLIAGQAVVIESDISCADLQKIYDHKPEYLTLLDENKDPVFTVSVSTDGSSVGKYGMVFNTTGEGKATITMTAPEKKNAAEYAAERFGHAMLNLKKVEAKYKEAIEAVDAELKAINDCIVKM